MKATDVRHKECDDSLFEGEGMNDTFSISVNQIFEGYHPPPDDYSIAHTRFQAERPYVCGLALGFEREGLRYEGNKGLKETKACLTCCIARLPQCLLSPCRLSVMFFGVVLVRQLKDYRAICRSFTNKLMILPKLLTKRVIAN